MNAGESPGPTNGKVAGGKPTTTELKEVSAEQITHAQSQRKAPAAAEINRLHSEIYEHARTSIEKAIRIGELLTQTRTQLRHGRWLALFACEPREYHDSQEQSSAPQRQACAFAGHRG